MTSNPFLIDFFPGYGLVEDRGIKEVKAIINRYESKTQGKSIFVRSYHYWLTDDGRDYPFAKEIMRRRENGNKDSTGFWKSIFE